MEIVKSNIFKILLLMSIICCLGSSISVWNHSAVLESQESGIAQIETITSTIQRVSKVELEHSHDDELIALVDGMCEELYSAGTGVSIFLVMMKHFLVWLKKLLWTGKN